MRARPDSEIYLGWGSCTKHAWDLFSDETSRVAVFHAWHALNRAWLAHQ